MKKFFLSLSLLLLVPVLMAVPVLGADLAGGYYITGDSALGNRTFYIPADYASGSLTYDSSGHLFNLTSSTIYLYCPDYPDYTISASRFSVFQYRTDSGYGSSYQELKLRNVSDTNVEILSASPPLSIGSAKLLVMILAVLVVGVGVFVILPRR